MSEHRYSQPEIDALYRAIAKRRDMRHFRSDPVEPEMLARLLRAAHMGPSVGYMQPRRFIRIASAELRTRLHALVEEERECTADALGERRNECMQLKVGGMRDCGELLVVALCDGRERHVFGRRTLPEMDLASTACATQNLWLAARAEGLGIGLVSLFDPAAVAELLAMPEGAKPIAILCLGHVDAFYDKPMLETGDRARRIPLEDLVGGDDWAGADG